MDLFVKMFGIWGSDRDVFWVVALTENIVRSFFSLLRLWFECISTYSLMRLHKSTWFAFQMTTTTLLGVSRCVVFCCAPISLRSLSLSLFFSFIAQSDFRLFSIPFSTLKNSALKRSTQWYFVTPFTAPNQFNGESSILIPFGVGAACFGMYVHA